MQYRRYYRILPWVLAAGIAAVVIISASPSCLSAAAPSKMFLIVSPFEVVQDEGDYQWLSTAMTECLKVIFQRLDLEIVENFWEDSSEGAEYVPLTIQDVRNWMKEGTDRRADYLATGTVVVSGEQIVILLTLSDISTERDGKEYQIEGAINNITNLIEQTYASIVEFTGLKIPAEVKQEIFSNCTGSPNALRHYGMSFHAADLSQKMNMLQSSVEADPDFVSAWMQLGLVLYVSGKPEEAKEAFFKVIQGSSRFKEAYNNLGVVLSDTSDTAGAIEAFEEALKIDSTYTDARFNLAKLLDKQKRYKKALKHYSALLKEKPEHLEIRFLSALVLDKLGRYDKALEEFRLISSRDPNRAEMFFIEKGKESRKEKNHAAAELFFRRALDINPDYHEAYSEMGVNSFLEGDYEKSRNYFMTAAKNIPDSAEVQHYLGLASAKTGFRTEAITAFRKAVELQNFKESNLELGKMYLEDERYAEAIESLNRFLKADPDSKEAKDLLSLATRKAEEETRVMQKKADFAGRRLDKMDEIVMDLNRRNAELETTLALVTGQSEKQETEIERLKKEKASLEKDLRTMMQNTLELNREIEALKNRNETLEETHRREMSEINSTRRAVDAELNALKGEYEQRIANLETREKQLLSDVEDLDAIRVRMKGATAELRDLEQALKKSEKESSLRDRELEKLAQKILVEEAEKDEFEKKLAVSNKKVQNLVRMSKDSEKTISLRDRRMEELAQKILSLEKEKKELEKKLAVSHANLQDQARESERLKTKTRDKLMDLAEEYRRRRLLEEALETYLLIIRLDPENGQAYFALGELYYDRKEFDKSEEMFRKASSFLGKEQR